MAAATGNSATHEWAAAPGNCPPQYTVPDADSGSRYSCQATGVVRVRINGTPWSQVWWNMAGDTATDYSAEARSRLGSTVDPKFDADYAAWRAWQDRAALIQQQAAGY